ncbi:MAG: MFS transporter [Hyphomicrobiales bacterium]
MTAASPTGLTNRPFYYSLPAVIVAGSLIAVIAFGVRSSSGLFTGPYTQAHGWGREVYALAMAVQNLMWGLGQPFVGMIADNFGTRRVVMAGAFVYAAGMVLMAYAATPAMLFLGGGVLMGLGIAMTSFSLIMAAFGRIVPPERRSWAFGIATAASSMGQFIFAPLGQAFIAAYGWQAAMLLLSSTLALILVLAIPLGVPGAARPTPAANEANLKMAEALKLAFGHGSYVLLVLGFFVCGFQLAFVVVHLPPYLIDRGISPGFAAWAIGMVGLFNVVGSYAAGVFGGKHSRRLGLSFIYFARAVVTVAFLVLPVSTGSVLAFTAAMGLLWLSTVPLTMGLVTLMFGTQYMATLYGFVFLSHQIGSFFGVWLGGYAYDRWGSYDIVWWLSVALSVFAGLVHLPIRERMARGFAAQALPA